MPKLNAKVNNKSEEIELVKTAEPKKKTNKKTTPKKETKNESKKATNNFQKIKAELKQVTWPSKKHMVKYSIATILMIIMLALFFVGISAIFDFLYGIARGWIN